MWPDEAQLILRKSNTFQTIHSKIVSGQHEDEKSDIDTIGAIIYGGKLGWTASGAYLEVIAIDSGNKLAVFDFDRLLGTNDSYISCVSEVRIPGVKSCCLAVGIQLVPNGGKICVISIQGSCVLGMIDFFDKVTTCHYVPKRQSDHSLRSLLRCFDGCLAVGTDQGKIVLLDLCFKRCKFVIDGLLSSEDNLEVQQCHIIFANVDPEEIMEHHEQSKQDEIYFGIQLEVLENAGHVQSIVVIPFSMTLVAGLDDGRMVLYDLENLQAFHLAYPPEKSAPLLYLSYLEPADDPRAYIYVWALHSSINGGIGVMHSIMFQHKYIDKTETVYRNFLSCSARLTMPMFEKSSCPVSCHSITKLIDEEEEQQLTLCAIAWTTNTSSTLMVFDLNQWYKEQMPEVGDWRSFPSYTAIFPLGELCPLDLWLDENMIVPFNSIQRPEEHFYPNSLSFDVSILTHNTILTAMWPGLQKLVLDNLVKAGSKAILEPTKYVQEMINAALVPQYQDFNVNLPMGIDLKREYLLTIALEYNCVAFLKKVAVAVADGSHIGSVPTEALGLSTVTDWIWNRARSLKDMSNNYCVPLFDYSSRNIDCGMQKTLTLCTRQLRIVANLMDLICTECEQYIPEHVHKILLNQLQSIQLASDYQEVTQWLLNVGLLPEGIWRSDSHMSSQPDEPLFVPYPYHLINSYYSTQRMKLSLSITENRLNVPSPFIYIDMFIEHSCDMQAITDLWKEQGGCGLYPPVSLQKMLRVLLIPDIPIEAKQILFVYLFMDINHVLSDGGYGPVVQNLIKFPAVFKMDPAAIKVTQSFWYLDHGDLNTAIEELISPLSQSHNLKQWQRNFLISTLLKQDAPHLALRILKAPGVPVEASLELQTLLSNDLVSEAFKFQRAKGEKNLLIQFYEGTMKIQKRDLLLDLSLNEEESKVLIDFLGKANISLTENLHFVYLLQRSDFVDAVSLVDKLMKSTRDRNYDLNMPKEILTIYHTTLEPTSRQLTFLAYSHPDKFQLKKFEDVPKPLSSSLIRQRLDPAAGIYQRSILSVKEAGNKEMFDDDEKHERSLPFLRRSGLGTFSFVQKTQTNNVVYPEIVNRQEMKRRLEEDKEKSAIQFNEYEGPRKRRKFDESEVPRKSLKDYDVSVLSRFNPKLKPKFNFNEGNESIQFSTANERTPEKQQTSALISPSTLLRTPIVEKAQRDESPERHRFTPQSILKSASHASLPGSITPLSYVSRKSFESEEKSIRFAIPGSSADTTMNSSALQISNETLETTHDKTVNESIVSTDDFFSPDTSKVQDQTMNNIKQNIEDAITTLDQTGAEVSERHESKMNVSEGHEDLSFLADAPYPRPPIRASSRSSHSGSPRSTRSNSRSVSPGIQHTLIVTRSKSRELEKEHELLEKQVDVVVATPEKPVERIEFNEPSTSMDNDKTSTPIVPLSQKRSQKSLGRAVLEKNLKQQLMSDIFGEYSKTNISQTDETLENNPESPIPNVSASDTDTSDVGFLSYEQTGILTGDTLVDQQMLNKMLGNETLTTSFGDPTMGDSTLRLLNASSTILSDSSNYEDSRDNLSVSDVKEPTVVSSPVKETAHLKDFQGQKVETEKESTSKHEPEPCEIEEAETETPVEQKEVHQKSSEAISIDDSEESYMEDYSDTEIDSSESEDKFANVSDNDDDVQEPEEFEEEHEEEYFEEDEEEDKVQEENELQQSDLSSESSFSSDHSEASTPKNLSQKDDEVISIGSTSDEDDDDNSDKHFQEISHNISSEKEETKRPIEQYYEEPNTLNQGLIMSHMETAHEIPETSYQLQTSMSQSQLYYNICEAQVQPQPVSQMNEAQMSDLLYGEVEIETDTDSLNLAIVEDEPDLSQKILSQEYERLSEENEVVAITETFEEPKVSKVATKVIEVKKSDVANVRVDIIKEVYDETVAQPSVSMVEEEIEDPPKEIVPSEVVIPVKGDISSKETNDDQAQQVEEMYHEIIGKDAEAQEIPVEEQNQNKAIVSPMENVVSPDALQTQEIHQETEVEVAGQDIEAQKLTVEGQDQNNGFERQGPVQMETDDVPIDLRSEVSEPTDDAVSKEPASEINEPMSAITDEKVGEDAVEMISSSTEQSEEEAIKVWLASDEVPEQSKETIEVVELDQIATVETAAQPHEEPLQSVISEVQEVTPPPVVKDEAMSIHPSPERQITAVEQELVVVQPLENVEEMVTSSENQPELLTETVETEISMPQPSTSNEADIKSDKRKSIYPEDPLDKTSICPQPDDGIEPDFLNKSDIYEKSDEPKTLPRKLRSRAKSVDQKLSALDSPLVKRSLRATSVPKSSELQEVSTTLRKPRRISVDTQLEHIEEDAPLDVTSTPKRRTITAITSSDTPSMLTRSASRRLSTEVMQEPTTPSRATRGSSKEISTARIKTRRITDKMEEDSTPEIEGNPSRKTRRISLSSRKSEEPDDNKSEVSVKSTRTTRKKLTSETESTTTDEVPKRKTRTRVTSVSSSDTSPTLDEGLETYSQSRRLTRHQQAMLAKSVRLPQQPSTSSMPMHREDKDQSEEISDSESVASLKSTTSVKSKQSTASKRSTRSKQLTKSKSAPVKRSTRSNSKGKQESEVEVEIGTRKRKATKPVHLAAIPEEDKASVKSSSSEEPEIPDEVPIKRSRKANKKYY